MRIRAATTADISALALIWLAGWHRGHASLVPEALEKLRTLESFTERLIEHLPQILCAENDTGITGFVITRDAELYQLFVSEAAQGTGAAQALIRAAEAVIRANGHAEAYLDCIPENTRARAFYRKMGWVESGIEPSILDTSEGAFSLDCMIFRKRL